MYSPQRLFERLWIFLTETLLALTIFRDDFSIPFAILYTVLLFLKCFHWITADRVDYMDQVPPPGPPALFHVRIVGITSLLLLLDIALVSYSLQSISYYGVSSMVLFASEFTILLASILGTTARYAVGLVDLRRARGREDAPAWEEKSMYLFYVDLAVGESPKPSSSLSQESTLIADFVKLLTYLSFFMVILLHYGLPLHVLREVYITFMSFLSRCSDLIRYRRATRDMNSQYPDATAEELERAGDPTCIICREEMVVSDEHARSEGPNETPKKLGCGHIFHFHCLRSWLERQQSCPTWWVGWEEGFGRMVLTTVGETYLLALQHPERVRPQRHNSKRQPLPQVQCLLQARCPKIKTSKCRRCFTTFSTPGHLHSRPKHKV